MTQFLIPNRSTSCENFWLRDLHQSKHHANPQYVDGSQTSDFTELLVHSKSDDLILQSTSSSTDPEFHRDILEEAYVLPGNDYVPSSSSCNSKLLLYHGDCDNKIPSSDIMHAVDVENEVSKLKITDILDDDSVRTDRRTNKCIDSSDKIDAEHSIRDIISKNDFYRFVLFKQHYEEYLNISQKYEEARTISYYLEEKYHEVMNQRDSLIRSNKELEKKLELKDTQLIEKEEELFQQIEKVFRLEEDCEKLRKEKEKIQEVKNQLEKNKNEIYKQLRMQADDADVQKHDFEKTKNDLIKQLSDIVLEKNNLERENIELKETVGDLELQLPKHYPNRKNIRNLQQEMTDLKVKVKQSATLNSQLKKGMKHLATCGLRKCSVCAYTRATFGEYSNNNRCRNAKISGCCPFQNDRCKLGIHFSSLEDNLLEDSANIAKRLSEYSFSSIQSNNAFSPSLPLAPLLRPSYIPYMDECSSVIVSEEDEHESYKNSTANSSLNDRSDGFYSDSGFSSDLYDPPSFSQGRFGSFRRATKWTTSFRKLIKRVSSRKQTNKEMKPGNSTS